MTNEQSSGATPLREIVRGVVSVPTASYLEHGVREHFATSVDDGGGGFITAGFDSKDFHRININIMVLYYQHVK